MNKLGIKVQSVLSKRGVRVLGKCSNIRGRGPEHAF